VKEQIKNLPIYCLKYSLPNAILLIERHLISEYDHGVLIDSWREVFEFARFERFIWDNLGTY
jgi:hypothetical protein